MPSSTVSKRYAKALFELFPGPKAAERALGDLKLWVGVLRDNPEFCRIIRHPEIREDRKLELAAHVRVGPEVRDFVKVLIAKKRIELLEAVVEDFEELLNDARNAVAAEVVTAVPLNGDLLHEFQVQVARLTGKNVRLENVVDPRVVGGVRLVIGDRVVDGTLVSKLGEIRREMTRA